MNIALCSAGDLFGGVEQFIVTFASELRRVSTHHLSVVLFARGPLSERLRARGIETQVVECARYDVRVVARLARHFRERRIDLVHTHGYKANLLCGSAARLSGARVVKTEHGLLEALSGLNGMRLAFNMRLDGALSRYLVDRIVFVSEDIRTQTAARYRGIEGEVIHNGIPRLTAGSRRPAGLAPGHFNVGVLGRLTAVKGHVYLLRAIASLDLPDLRLHILGDGELRDELETWVQAHGLEPRVFFLGFRGDVQDYLRWFDAVVMPSLHEGLPYALLEAAYWGVPLVASRVGGIREVLERADAGLLVDPGNVTALAGAVARLHADPDLRRRLGENAHRTVVDRFSIDAMVDKYLGAYDRTLRGRAA